MAKFEYTVSDAEAEHYNTLRVQRGWSWDTLADYFENNCPADPTAPFYAEWARSQREATPKRAAKKGTERVTKTAPEQR
jgi:hypothetical protein